MVGGGSGSGLEALWKDGARCSPVVASMTARARGDIGHLTDIQFPVVLGIVGDIGELTDLTGLVELPSGIVVCGWAGRRPHVGKSWD